MDAKLARPKSYQDGAIGGGDGSKQEQSAQELARKLALEEQSAHARGDDGAFMIDD